MTSHMFTWLPGDEPPSRQTERGIGYVTNSTVEQRNDRARRPPTQLGYISEAINRFSSVPGVTVKQSVFKKQPYERAVK
jgi:hypothetical protein